MRALVRTLGLLLTGFGTFLWVFGARSTTSVAPPPPTAAPIRPATRAAIPHRPKPIVEPKHEPLSTAALIWINPKPPPPRHKFQIFLHKEDGWFETKIPVTSDLQVLVVCNDKTEGNVLPSRWVEAMIGHSTFSQAADQDQRALVIETVSSDNDPRRGSSDRAHYLTISGQAFQTLKLKLLAGSEAPSEVRCSVTIAENPFDWSQPQTLTANQQRELSELAKWQVTK